MELAESGRIDVLVNNAGIVVYGAVKELPLSEFRRAMETNFFGALLCIQLWCLGCVNEVAVGSSMLRR